MMAITKTLGLTSIKGDNMKKLTLMAIAAAIGIGIFGCSPAARDQYNDAGQDVGNATTKTGEAMATDAGNAKAAADNTLMTSKVTSALQSASGLVTKDINVDTDSKAKTITLNGSVPTDTNKNQAETVAKGIAGSELTVVNNLMITGK